jgi:hypothetical protein
MLHSLATVATERPGRYAAQLVRHLGRRSETRWDEPEGYLKFQNGGKCDMRAEAAALRLDAYADNEEALARVEHIVKSHLERFAVQDVLAVHWERQS